MTGSETPPAPPAFRLAYVPGVTPGKWVRTWQERWPKTPLHLVDVSAADAADTVLRGDADAGLLRLPVDRAVFSAIPLYTETTVVVVPKGHLVTAADEVLAGELADDVVFHPLDDTLTWERRPGRPALERPATTGDAVELVAAGVGLLLVPQSLARLHHRRDLTYRPVTDAPQSSVALVWPEERTTDQVEDFIGVVRGRTVNSTRGRRPAAAEPSRDSRRGERQGKRPEERARGASAPRGAVGGRTSSAKKPRRGSGRGKPRRRT
ncbi:LysR substrate-binding domain-containing protein [Streptomyces sp. JJ66]|uniref:LysR substrate-binding domain-containing protein n=1 Tax=Streptomyces sp. JJ66 TaxID=2803843 RepID=UPI0027E35BAD|nr:LysR substrate-binding domain-containing protein [Streptomyces sp. JJ66]